MRFSHFGCVNCLGSFNGIKFPVKIDQDNSTKSYQCFLGSGEVSLYTGVCHVTEVDHLFEFVPFSHRKTTVKVRI